MKEKVHAVRLSEEKWHSLEAQEVYDELQSRLEGLDQQEAAERLRFYGPNALPVKKPPTIWAILLHQVLNPLIFILLAAAVASVAIGEGTDAIFILVVIALNSGLGAYQEYHAEKSAASLQRLLKIKARLRRDKKEHDIPSEEVVPGDIVLLESGNKVPKTRVEDLAAAIDWTFLPDLGLWAYVLAGIVLTAIMQSSSATIAVILTTLFSGIIDFRQGAGMVIGANVGTTVTILLGAIGGIPAKKQAAVSSLAFTVGTALVALASLPLLDS